MAVMAQERTFDWFGSQAARFGLRVTVNGTSSRDPEDRGLLLIDRQGHVVDASGYARYVGGRRAWVEAREESPVIDIHILEGRWVGKVALNLDPGDGGFGDGIQAQCGQDGDRGSLRSLTRTILHLERDAEAGARRA